MPQLNVAKEAVWIIDDTGIPKKGKHSVGVARQYCGVLGKQDNCQVAVSLSLATEEASVPLAYRRLYLPPEWAEDGARRRRAGVPEVRRSGLRPRRRSRSSSWKDCLLEGPSKLLRSGRCRLWGEDCLSSAPGATWGWTIWWA